MQTATATYELPEETALLERPALRAAKILVVEDDGEMRSWVEEVLQEEGYQAITAPDTLSALILLLKEGADVVVTDWKMPDLDGLQLLGSIRRCRPGLPVVFVSAYVDGALVRRVMDGGAFSCLAKPFQRKQLLAHVEGALVCSRLSRPDDRGAADPSSASEPGVA